MPSEQSERYRKAAEKSEELREMAHDEYPEGEVTAKINIFDDGTFAVVARHAHQRSFAGDLQTTHEMWDYNSENDQLVRKTWKYPLGRPPYAAPAVTEEVVLDGE